MERRNQGDAPISAIVPVGFALRMRHGHAYGPYPWRSVADSYVAQEHQLRTFSHRGTRFVAALLQRKTR
jgi:hypothetical protein